jgi:hypothetical protein
MCPVRYCMANRLIQKAVYIFLYVLVLCPLFPLKRSKWRQLCSQMINAFHCIGKVVPLFNYAPHHEHLRWSESIAPHILKFGTVWQGVASFRPRSIHFWGDSPSPHWMDGSVGPRGDKALWRTENFPAPQELNGDFSSVHPTVYSVSFPCGHESCSDDKNEGSLAFRS